MTIRLRVQPNARAQGFHGVIATQDGSRLRLSVAAAPADGEANRAVIQAMAQALQVAPAAISLVHGLKGREKLLRATGNSARLAAALARLSAA